MTQQLTLDQELEKKMTADKPYRSLAGDILPWEFDTCPQCSHDYQDVCPNCGYQTKGTI